MAKLERRIRVLLADDHRIVREGLRKLLEAECDIEVVGEADNGRAAVAQTRQLHPAVVLMDIAMPQLNGLEASRQIRQLEPNTKVLILTSHSEDVYVESALALGVAGYLVKQTSGAFLTKAIRAIDQGKVCYSPPVAERLRQRQSRGREGQRFSPETSFHLSTREVEVLQLIAEGASNKQMAGILGIGIKTVEKHRASLSRKLDIHDTASLTRYAICTGVIEVVPRASVGGRSGFVEIGQPERTA